MKLFLVVVWIYTCVAAVIEKDSRVIEFSYKGYNSILGDQVWKQGNPGPSFQLPPHFVYSLLNSKNTFCKSHDWDLDEFRCKPPLAVDEIHGTCITDPSHRHIDYNEEGIVSCTLDSSIDL